MYFPTLPLSFELARNRQGKVDKSVREERDARLQRMRHAGAVEPLAQRRRKVNREITQHELFDVGQRLPAAQREICVRARAGVAALDAPAEELRLVDTRSQLRTADRYRREEPFRIRS